MLGIWDHFFSNCSQFPMETENCMEKVPGEMEDRGITFNNGLFLILLGRNLEKS